MMHNKQYMSHINYFFVRTKVGLYSCAGAFNSLLLISYARTQIIHMTYVLFFTLFALWVLCFLYVCVGLFFICYYDRKKGYERAYELLQTHGMCWYHGECIPAQEAMFLLPYVRIVTIRDHQIFCV